MMSTSFGVFDVEKQQISPLRFAPVEMTALRWIREMVDFAKRSKMSLMEGVRGHVS